MDRRKFIKNAITTLAFGGVTLDMITELEAKPKIKAKIKNSNKKEGTNQNLVERAIDLTLNYGLKENYDSDTIAYYSEVSFVGCTTSTIYKVILKTDKKGNRRSFNLSYETLNYNNDVLAEAHFLEEYVNGIIEPDKKDSANSQGYVCSLNKGTIKKNGKIVCKDNKIIHEHYKDTLLNFIAVSKETRKYKKGKP